MALIQHNVKTWFGDTEDAFTKYFNNTFNRKLIGEELAFTPSITKSFDLSVDSTYHKIANAAADTFIIGIYKIKQFVLQDIEFVELEDDTKQALRDAVCEAVQHSIINRNFPFERTNGSSIAGGNYSVAIDAPAYTFSSDIFGKFAWNLIQISGIDDYEVVEDEFVIYEYQSNGNVKIIKTLGDI